MEKGVVALMAVAMVMAAAMVGMGGRGVRAQGSSGCVKDLVVCQSAILNASMKPNSECCSSLKNAVTKDLDCLCNIYKTDSIFQSLNLNKTRAMELPALCKITASLSLCNNTSATRPSSPVPSSETTPSAPAAGSSTGSGAMKLGWDVKPWWALVFLSALLIGL